MSPEDFDRIHRELEASGKVAMEKMRELMRTVSQHFPSRAVEVVENATAFFRHEITMYSICAAFAPPQLSRHLAGECQRMTERIIVELVAPLHDELGEEKTLELVTLIKHLNDNYFKLITDAQNIANRNREGD